MSAGRRLNAEDVYPAQDMFVELLSDISDFHTQGGEPWPSVGEFIRSEVPVLQQLTISRSRCLDTEPSS